MPNRTTQDYEGPLVAPQLQAALDAALQDDKELNFDASWGESNASSDFVQ